MIKKLKDEDKRIYWAASYVYFNYLLQLEYAEMSLVCHN